jgi:two-component sensor histidine kinase
VQLALSQMTPVVLLVTEAATNSAKHVFRQGQGSKFEVELKPVGARMLRLSMRDDGPGMPEREAPASSLGLRIMRGLAAQLGGALHFENDSGAKVWLAFPRD